MLFVKALSYHPSVRIICDWRLPEVSQKSQSHALRLCKHLCPVGQSPGGSACACCFCGSLQSSLTNTVFQMLASWFCLLQACLAQLMWLALKAACQWLHLSKNDLCPEGSACQWVLLQKVNGKAGVSQEHCMTLAAATQCSCSGYFVSRALHDCGCLLCRK